MSTVLRSALSYKSTEHLEPGAHTVTLHGVDLHYQVSGNGPLLFIVSPGWGIGSGYLQRGFRFLQDHFRVVFVDTRGSGLSGLPSASGPGEFGGDRAVLCGTLSRLRRTNDPRRQPGARLHGGQ